MSPKQLASKILEYSGSTSLMVPGQLTATIGSAAVQDALNRGWIRPDSETGFLMLTDQQTQINDMREFAAASDPPTPPARPPGAPPRMESARNFVMNHSNRLHETLGLGGDTSGSGGAPGSGQPQGQPAAPPQQTPTSPAPNKPNQDYLVGQDVVVANEGKSYQAKIKARKPDGTYVLTFGVNKPADQSKAFRREEIQLIAPAGTSKPDTVQALR